MAENKKNIPSFDEKSMKGSYSCIYTDLALELHSQVLEEEESEEISGVELEQSETGGVCLTWVKVTTEEGAEAIGKPVGNYVTIESKALKESDVDAHERIIKILADNLSELYNLKEKDSVLVIGLGNQWVTPDSLGPKVVSKLLVTRHIKEAIPDAIDERVRPVSALSPGVLGITGIETQETVKGLVERVKPDLVIAIDALASRSAERINTTIQFSDTGVAPGAGVGNRRKTLDLETLGVPVIAIGVPTVIHAATLVNDAMDAILGAMKSQDETGGEFYEMLDNLSNEDKYHLIREMLDPYTGNMFVTPKDVDAVIDRLSNIIANALNISLHEGVSKEDINRYMY